MSRHGGDRACTRAVASSKGLPFTRRRWSAIDSTAMVACVRGTCSRSWGREGRERAPATRRAKSLTWPPRRRPARQVVGRTMDDCAWRRDLGGCLRRHRGGPGVRALLWCEDEAHRAQISGTFYAEGIEVVLDAHLTFDLVIVDSPWRRQHRPEDGILCGSSSGLSGDHAR